MRNGQRCAAYVGQVQTTQYNIRSYTYIVLVSLLKHHFLVPRNGGIDPFREFSVRVIVTGYEPGM